MTHERRLPGAANRKVAEHIRAFHAAEAGSAELYRAVAWYFRAEKSLGRLFRIIDVPPKRRRRERLRLARIREQIDAVGEIGMLLEDVFQTRQCVALEEADWILETWPCAAIRDGAIGHSVQERFAFAGRAYGGGGVSMPQWQRYFGIVESHLSQCSECAEHVWSGARRICDAWKADKYQRRAFIERVQRDLEAVFQ